MTGDSARLSHHLDCLLDATISCHCNSLPQLEKRLFLNHLLVDYAAVLSHIVVVRALFLIRASDEVNDAMSNSGQRLAFVTARRLAVIRCQPNTVRGPNCPATT